MDQQQHKLKIRYRDSSEHAALGSKDFKSVQCLPSINPCLRISRRISDGGTHVHTLSNSKNRIETKLKPPTNLSGP